MATTLAHMTTQLVAAPTEVVFAYLRDPIRLGRWSLGWFRIDADAAGLVVDYLVGTPHKLVRRISARIVPGPELGYADGTCLVTLTAWRPADMDNERWARLRAAHQAEIFLIKAQIESRDRQGQGFAQDPPKA